MVAQGFADRKLQEDDIRRIAGSSPRQYHARMGFSDTLFICFAALLLFGPKKLPEIARQIGKALNEFKRASNEFKAQIESEIHQLDRENARQERDRRAKEWADKAQNEQLEKDRLQQQSPEQERQLPSPVAPPPGTVPALMVSSESAMADEIESPEKVSHD